MAPATPGLHRPGHTALRRLHAKDACAVRSQSGRNPFAGKTFAITGRLRSARKTRRHVHQDARQGNRHCVTEPTISLASNSGEELEAARALGVARRAAERAPTAGSDGQGSQADGEARRGTRPFGSPAPRRLVAPLAASPRKTRATAHRPAPAKGSAPYRARALLSAEARRRVLVGGGGAPAPRGDAPARVAPAGPSTIQPLGLGSESTTRLAARRREQLAARTI